MLLLGNGRLRRRCVYLHWASADYPMPWPSFITKIKIPPQSSPSLLRKSWILRNAVTDFHFSLLTHFINLQLLFFLILSDFVFIVFEYCRWKFIYILNQISQSVHYADNNWSAQIQKRLYREKASYLIEVGGKTSWFAKNISVCVYSVNRFIAVKLREKWTLKIRKTAVSQQLAHATFYTSKKKCFFFVRKVCKSRISHREI